MKILVALVSVLLVSPGFAAEEIDSACEYMVPRDLRLEQVTAHANGMLLGDRPGARPVYCIREGRYQIPPNTNFGTVRSEVTVRGLGNVTLVGTFAINAGGSSEMGETMGKFVLRDLTIDGQVLIRNDLANRAQVVLDNLKIQNAYQFPNASIRDFGRNPDARKAGILVTSKVDPESSYLDLKVLRSEIRDSDVGFMIQSSEGRGQIEFREMKFQNNRVCYHSDVSVSNFGSYQTNIFDSLFENSTVGFWLGSGSNKVSLLGESNRFTNVQTKVKGSPENLRE